MSSLSQTDFSNLVYALKGDGMISFEEAQATYLDISSKDPFGTLSHLFSLILNHDSYLTTACLVYASTLFARLSTVADIQYPPELSSQMHDVLIAILSSYSVYKPIHISHVFHVLTQLIKSFVLTNEWPDVVPYVISLLESPLRHHCLSFLTSMVLLSPQDDILSLLPQCFNETTDENVLSAQVSLMLALAHVDSSVAMSLPASFPLFTSLKGQPLQSALSSLLDLFQYFVEEYEDVFTYAAGPLTESLFRNEIDDGDRIELIECLERMASASPAFLDKMSLEDLIQFAFSVFAAQEEGEDMALFNATLSLLTLYPKEEIVPFLTHEDHGIVSTAALLSICTPLPHQLRQLSVNIARGDNPIAAALAVESLEGITGEESIELLTSLPFATPALATCVESLTKSTLHNYSEQLMSLAQNCDILESMRIMSCLAEVCELPFGQLFELCLSSSENADEKQRESLLVSASKFFKRIQNPDLQFQLASALFSQEDLIHHKGSRLIAETLGPAFAPLLPTVLPNLVAISNQEILTALDSNSKWSDLTGYQVLSMPGTGMKMLFYDDQFNQIATAVDSIGDYMKAAGRLSQDHMESIISVIERGLLFIYDERVRLSVFKLVCQVSLVFPEAAPQLAPNVEEFLEKEASINTKSDAFNELGNFVREFKGDPALLSPYLSICTNEALKMMGDNNFFICQWANLGLFKELVIRMKEATIPSFFTLMSESETKDDDGRWSCGLLADFMQYGPAFEGKDFFIDSLMQNIWSEDEAIRRMALFAVGRANKGTGREREIMQILKDEIFREGAKEGSLSEGTDSAISSYCVLSEATGEGIEEIADMLPVKDDSDEAKVVYLYVMKLVKEGKVSGATKERFIREVTDILASDDMGDAIRGELEAAGLILDIMNKF